MTTALFAKPRRSIADMGKLAHLVLLDMLAEEQSRA